MAGHLLARQLRRTVPELRVALYEKSTEDPHKLGESMVEIATNYFIRRLGLSSYLYDRHFPKNGLRYFYDDANRSTSLEEMSEIGSESLPFHPAFQIDRARLDSDLAAMNAADGVEIHRGVQVREVELGSGGGLHTFSVRPVGGGAARSVRARWLIDASGRARTLARSEGLARPEAELANASVWGRFEGVADVDTMGSEAFRARVRHTPRRLSTMHFHYPGYWIWFIPLRDGVTSIGLVADSSVFTPELRTQEGFVAFLNQHQAVSSLIEQAKPVDHGCYTSLAYGTSRFFGAGRWGLTGEAACFTDPLYSPGSDFIALENDFLTDLIQRDTQGESFEAVAERAELYDQFMSFRQEATFELYRGQYALLGSYELGKLKWNFDIGSYYNIWVDAYMRDQHLDRTWLESQIAQRPLVLRSLAHVRTALEKVRAHLEATGAYHRRNLGEYIDGRECLWFLTDVGEASTDAETLERMGELFNRFRSDALESLGAEPREPLALPRFMARRGFL
jgi:flavin-dependent dehydrogenase